MVRDHNSKGPQWMTTMDRDHNEIDHDRYIPKHDGGFEVTILW